MLHTIGPVIARLPWALCNAYRSGFERVEPISMSSCYAPHCRPLK
jgi:hypothetical protein